MRTSGSPNELCPVCFGYGIFTPGPRLCFACDGDGEVTNDQMHFWRRQIKILRIGKDQPDPQWPSNQILPEVRPWLGPPGAVMRAIQFEREYEKTFVDVWLSKPPVLDWMRLCDESQKLPNGCKIGETRGHWDVDENAGPWLVNESWGEDRRGLNNEQFEKEVKSRDDGWGCKPKMKKHVCGVPREVKKEPKKTKNEATVNAVQWVVENEVLWVENPRGLNYEPFENRDDGWESEPEEKKDDSEVPREVKKEAKLNAKHWVVEDEVLWVENPRGLIYERRDDGWESEPEEKKDDWEVPREVKNEAKMNAVQWVVEDEVLWVENQRGLNYEPFESRDDGWGSEPEEKKDDWEVPREEKKEPKTEKEAKMEVKKPKKTKKEAKMEEKIGEAKSDQDIQVIEVQEIRYSVSVKYGDFEKFFEQLNKNKFK